MKNKAHLFGLYLPLFIIITLMACAFRTAALLLDFNPETAYFEDKLFIGIANISAVAGAFILFTFLINGKKDIKLIPEFSNVPTVFASVLAIGSLIFLFADTVSTLKLRLGGAYSPAVTSRLTGLMLILTAVLSAVLAVYFVLNLLLSKHQNRTRSNLALVSVFFFASYAGYLYFDTSLPLNAPNKLVDQMAYLFLAVFFLYETRLALGRAKWRGYIAFGFIGALLTAYSSIPSIIYIVVEKNSVSSSIYESVLTFSLFIFITVRTLMTGELIIDTVSPKMQFIIDASAERDLAVKESIPISEENRESDASDNQIALADIADIDKTDEDVRRAEAEEIEKQELIDKIEKLSTQEDG